MEGTPVARRPDIKACAELLRLHASIGAPALTAVGEYIARVPFAWPPMVASFSMIGFAQAWNDISDRELDAVAKPSRPIPSNRISVTGARNLAAALFLASLAASLELTAAARTLLWCDLALAAAYSLGLKSVPVSGNVVVASVSASTLLLGVDPMQPDTALRVATSVVFLFILGDEFFKVGLDRDADGRWGVRTLATVFGLVAVKRGVLICGWLLIADLVIVLVTDGAARRFSAVSLVTILPAILWSVSILLDCAPSTKDLARARQVWLVAWTPGVISLLALR